MTNCDRTQLQKPFYCTHMDFVKSTTIAPFSCDLFTVQFYDKSVCMNQIKKKYIYLHLLISACLYEFSLTLQFSNLILVSWSCYSAFKLVSATFHSKTIVDMSLNRPSILSLDDLADLRSMVRLDFRRPFRRPACTSQATDCRNLVYQVVAHESENSPPIMNESHHVLRQERRRGRINTVQIPRSKSKS